MRRDLEKYRTEDWSVLEHDSEDMLRRARALRAKFSLLGFIAILLLALVRIL